MPHCRICGWTGYEEHGIEFFGEPHRVPASEWFWVQVLSGKYGATHRADPDGEGLAHLVNSEIDLWGSGAWVCDTCWDEVLRDTEHYPERPGVDEVAAAGRAWQRLYGVVPPRFVHTEQGVNEQNPRGFRKSLAAYVLVNASLVAIWYANHPRDWFWPVWPIGGWGLVLAVKLWRTYRRTPTTEERE